MVRIGDIARWLRTTSTIRNISDQPARSLSDTVACRYVVAVLGAWAAEGVTYPFDLTKTRLQIQSEVATAKHGYKMENHGMIQTAMRIAQQEGVNKLFSGMIPMLQRHVIYAGFRLVLYEQYRIFFRDNTGKLSFAMGSVGALSSGALAQLIATPTDVVKTHMQAEGRRILQGKKRRFQNCRDCYKRLYAESGILGFWRGALSSGALAQLIATPTDVVKTHMQAEGRRILQGKKRRFQNCRDCYKRLYAESGILGFWRGAIPNAGRAALVSLGDVAAYDYSKQFLARTFGMADNALLHGASALCAGFVAALLATPADVIKTRIMNQPVGPDGRGLIYNGMFDCLKQSVANEGILSVYKGFLPLWMRLGPWALIYWLSFENIMIAIGGKTF